MDKDVEAKHGFLEFISQLCRFLSAALGSSLNLVVLQHSGLEIEAYCLCHVVSTECVRCDARSSRSVPSTLAITNR